MWIGSDGVLATPPTNESKATAAMQGTVGTMPKGKVTVNRKLTSNTILLKVKGKTSTDHKQLS